MRWIPICYLSRKQKKYFNESFEENQTLEIFYPNEKKSSPGFLIEMQLERKCLIHQGWAIILRKEMTKHTHTHTHKHTHKHSQAKKTHALLQTVLTFAWTHALSHSLFQKHAHTRALAHTKTLNRNLSRNCFVFWNQMHQMRNLQFLISRWFHFHSTLILNNLISSKVGFLHCASILGSLSSLAEC